MAVRPMSNEQFGSRCNQSLQVSVLCYVYTVRLSSYRNVTFVVFLVAYLSKNKLARIGIFVGTMTAAASSVRMLVVIVILLKSY